MLALGCMYSPGLSHSGSGSRVLHKGADLVGPAFCAILGPSSSGDQVLGERCCPQLKAATYRLPHPSRSVFWVYNGHAFSGVPCMSSGELISGCDPPGDVNHPESQEVLVSNEVCLHFGIGCLSGAAIACFWLWLHLPACLWWAIGWSAAH